ncbi:hypothetical protein Cni_G16227 [Canna indica]|uniref:DUF659 domain-containing protein n=1 Tax=Canna indica TaxID=4628 RepID=A0AAQ3QGK2_9LILI|nr:hypothetical protein Cni_G16227 [Canna indica]
MYDGWTDRKRRSICNFLVNNPKEFFFLYSLDTSDISKTTDKILKMLDDAIKFVGEENIVQVVTDNAANYKAAGEMLMQQRNTLYWTPCAAHCIDLILEDKKAKGVTRFTTAYLTLNCLNDNKVALMSMFSSKDWKSNGKPAMGFIYEGMSSAKERMKSDDADIKHRLYNCMGSLVLDQTKRNKISVQLPNFHYARGLFGMDTAKSSRKTMLHAEWWDFYGDGCPELKKFAIRVLSLTCSSSGYEHNWSAFEMVHTKKRNCLHQKKMNDLVYVMYTLKLKSKQIKRIFFLLMISILMMNGSLNNEMRMFMKQMMRVINNHM